MAEQAKSQKPKAKSQNGRSERIEANEARSQNGGLERVDAERVKCQEPGVRDRDGSRPPYELRQRLILFAAACLKLGGRLARSTPGRYVAGQLMRASASAGANYHEARGAESPADFAHKLQIALKEMKEAHYWLMLVAVSGLMPADAVQDLSGEAEELVRILAKSVVTAKKRR